MWAALIPQAGDQSRAYFVYPKTMGYRLQGESMLPSFRAVSPRKPTLPSRIIAPTGKVSDHWRALTSATLGWSIAYRDGVALLGDAAATTDPTYGQGLSFALRGARVLRDELTNNSDWDAAGHRYAELHRRSFHCVP